jgi:hypothetical protein
MGFDHSCSHGIGSKQNPCHCYKKLKGKTGFYTI